MKTPALRKKTGRPPLADAPADKRITVRVTAAQRLELRRVASDNSTGMSGVIREAVDEYVGDYSDRRPFVRTKR
jgi:hypothetical protein